TLAELASSGPMPLEGDITDRDGLGSADHLAGEWIAFVQPGHTVAAQDPRDRPGRDTDVWGECVGSATAFTTSGKLSIFYVGVGLVGDRVWPRRAVLVAVTAGLVEAVDPAVRALSRHAHRLGDMCNGLARPNAFDEQSPT